MELLETIDRPYSVLPPGFHSFKAQNKTKISVLVFIERQVLFFASIIFHLTFNSLGSRLKGSVQSKRLIQVE